MNDDLPTYESAVDRDHWPIIARYIRPHDLCNAVLVCKRWYTVFQPYLWGSPASHFGIGNDAPYTALTRFRHSLHSVRLSTREFTHTLNLPPAHAEMYGGPGPDWLRDIFEMLPKLQSLIVHKVPFFDHAALSTLRQPSTLSHNVVPSFSLRLLDASSARNATPSGLRTALSHLPKLAYLDFSKTAAAKDLTVLSSLIYLPMLRVLRLNGLSLKDEEIATIAPAILRRVWSLELEDNQITDRGANILIEHCFNKIPTTSAHANIFLPPDHHKNGQDFTISRAIADRLVTGQNLPLLLELDDTHGIIELNLSGNPITVDAISSISQTGRLSVLDVGHVASCSPASESTSRLSGEPSSGYVKPGFQIVIQTLMTTTLNDLSYLRIHHSVVTQEMLSKNQFNPKSLSKLRTLVLTDVPLRCPDHDIPNRFLRFLSICSNESRQSRLKAGSSYALPPGRNRALAEKDYARQLFALQRIVLEMEIPDIRQHAFKVSSSGWQKRHAGPSSTEDPDSDALWNAAKDDFSFFDDEERVVERNAEKPSAGTNKTPQPGARSAHPIIAVDTIAEISKFRRDRKAAHEAAIRQKAADTYVDSYWPGEISVVREPLAQRNVFEQRHFHGYSYERGWYYR